MVIRQKTSYSTNSLKGKDIDSQANHIENTVKKIDTTPIQDPDLVELAGHHAYNKPEVGSFIEVNNKHFDVVDTIYDHPTGLDALTVQNVETGELTVVYVGSEQLQEDWIDTNLRLPSRIPPAQLHAANDYFDYVEETFGPVDSITGNSLGGANTNAVAIENPHVRAVTLNPAILPSGMVDPDKNYSNITNYYGEYDILTTIQKSIGMDHRIPGEKHTIHNGVPLPAALVSNHTGYVDRDANGNFTIEIGTEGEPGYGHIHVGAADHIVTSLWTGEALYGGPSQPIKIDKAFMDQLVSGIRNTVIERLSLAHGYLENSHEIVVDEGEQFNRRVTELQTTFQTMLDELAAEPMFNGIASTGHLLKSSIDGLIALVDLAEENCRVFNVVLNSKPMELVEYVVSVDISVESLFAPLRNYLMDVRNDIDDLVSNIRTFVYDDIPDLFKGGKDSYVDAVVGELHDHYSIVNKNSDAVFNQLHQFEAQVDGVAEAFHNKDQDLANAIDTKTAPVPDTYTVQQTAVFTIDDSPYLENKMKIKELQVNAAHNMLRTIVTSKITPILLGIQGGIFLIEKTLEFILHTIDSTTRNLLYRTPAGLLIRLFTDFEQRVLDAAAAVKQPIIEMEATVEGLRKGIGKLIVNLPQLIDEFKPYLDTAIFDNGRYEDVRLYNIASSSILREMEILFNDIIFQLSSEEGKAITSIQDVSKSVKGNMVLLNDQVERGTV
ncbi:SA1320 family protein [Virgibacillus kimchii]